MGNADFLPGRLAGLVRKAIEQELITLSRGAEILRLGLGKMRVCRFMGGLIQVILDRFSFTAGILSPQPN